MYWLACVCDSQLVEGMWTLCAVIAWCATAHVCVCVRARVRVCVCVCSGFVPLGKRTRQAVLATTPELSALNARLRDMAHDCLVLTEQVCDTHTHTHTQTHTHFDFVLFSDL